MAVEQLNWREKTFICQSWSEVQFFWFSPYGGLPFIFRVTVFMTVSAIAGYMWRYQHLCGSE